MSFHLGRPPLVALGALALLTTTSVAFAQTATVTPILKNGPDAEKKVLVVIGDGFAEADQASYRQYVQDAVIDGVFSQDDFFRANHTAFNIYRVDVVSPASGVSITRYSAGCGTRTGSDDVLNTACTATSTLPCYTHNTSFGYVFTNCWGRCWMEGTTNTESSIKAVLDQLVPKRDLEMRILHVATGEGGGCGGGSKLSVTSGTSWQVLAHEMGHMLPGLYDEYVASSLATTSYVTAVGNVNNKNCSTNLNRTNVVWSAFLEPDIALPTTFDNTWMDVDDTVGMFEGCATYGRSIYRPVQNCRMNGNNNQFCPVCSAVLAESVDGFTDELSDYTSYVNHTASECRSTGEAINYTAGAEVSNSSTTATATVMCPVRRVREGSSFTNWLSGEAFVVDRNSTADVCCSLYARTPNGNIEAGPSVCSSGSGATEQRLKLNFPKVHMDYTFAHFSVKCTMPPAQSGNASRVVSYRVGQQYY